ncbi:MAG: transposase [Nitrospinales bacterium]
MGRKRRSFSKAFKLEAVRLVIDGGESIARVARDLGVRDTILGRWKQEYEKDRLNAFPGQGQLKPEDEELLRLRRENARLRMERDILKKAAVIFSKDSQ